MRKLYGAVDLGRYGLAHSLIGWARCVVWCHCQGVQMLAPNWFALRLGPWLRNERDKRLYWLLFDDRSSVRGWRKLLIQARARRVAAEAFERESPFGDQTVVVFDIAVTGGAPEHFDFIRPYAALLRDQLWSMTRSQRRPDEPARPFAAVHVRLGDFSAPSDPDAVANNARLPIDWYVDQVRAIQAALPDLAVRVFSDGSDADLRSLLQLSGVARVEKRESITDLLDMSQAAVLVASRSGFSSWASFLGDVPRISMTGRSMEPLSVDPSLNWEAGFGAPIPRQFVKAILDRTPAAALR